MVARRAVAWVCVAVVLLTCWVPAVIFGRHASSNDTRNGLHDSPTAPALPLVFDHIDRVIPSPQKMDPTPGHLSWLAVRSHPMSLGLKAAAHSRRCINVGYPGTLQKLHCLLSV